MGIRSKLLWPIVIAFAVLVAVIHFYFVPRWLDTARDAALRHEHEILSAMETGMVQDLLRGDLAAIYATLNDQIDNRSGVWAWLELRNASGKRLYPLHPQPRPTGEYLVTLDHTLEWDEAKVAHISLVADLEVEYLAALAQMRGIEQVVLVVLFILLAVGLWLQARWVRRPLLRLQQAADQVAEGHFEVDLPPAARDEIGRLTQAFDLMRRNLQATQQVLIDARQEAEQASLAKSEFLSRMSHELRTPLNAILGFAQLMELEARDPRDREFTAEIIKAGDHLLELIDEVLDLARIEAGRAELVVDEVEARRLCEESLVLVRSLARERGIRLVTRIDAAVGTRVRVDDTRFKQVLLNLLSNAIKYNRRNGSVVLACEPAASGRLRFSVSDTGKGLDPIQQRRLFSPFDRLGAEKGAEQGTGIGLVIAKRLIEEMGGEIGCQSHAGQGSTFWVEVDTVLPSDHQDDSGPDAAVGGTPDSVAADASPATLLYIEDNPTNLHLVRRIIEQRSCYCLLSAAQAEQGLALARQHQPDLVLMDISLPDMDGFTALAKLRTWPETQDIPVIAVSANAMPGDVARGQAAGFATYLTKPIDVTSLLETISAVLSEGEGGAKQSSERGRSHCCPTKY